MGKSGSFSPKYGHIRTRSFEYALHETYCDHFLLQKIPSFDRPLPSAGFSERISVGQKFAEGILTSKCPAALFLGYSYREKSLLASPRRWGGVVTERGREKERTNLMYSFLHFFPVAALASKDLAVKLTSARSSQTLI